MKLPPSYLIDETGGGHVLSGPGPVYRITPNDAEPQIEYRRRPLAYWTGSVPGETIFFIARLDEISRRSVGMERIKALSQLAKVFREWT